MKKLFLVAAAVVTVNGALAETVIITPEERTQIREYVVKRKVSAAPAGLKISVGAVVPETVEMYTIDGIPSATNYRYVVVDGRTALIDPGTRKIVEIID